MGDWLKLSLLLVGATALAYLISAFVAWDADPGQWGTRARVFHVIISGVLAWCAVPFVMGWFR